MISMLIFDQDVKEQKMLITHSKDAVAFCSDDQLNIETVTDKKGVEGFLKKHELMDAAFLDITDTDGIDLSKNIRNAYELSELLVIADASISPMEYMTPDIRAASLLLRPFGTEQSRQVVNQFFHAYYRNQAGQKEERKMVIENRQGKISIPYSKIYYLEVREKKIFVRLKDKEYSKYGTLENVLKELSDDFIRCHRSFAVNKHYIDRVKLSENAIYLEHNIMVPLSRSYKAELKEYMKSLQTKE